MLYWKYVDPERSLWPLVRRIAGRVLWTSYNEEGLTADLDLAGELVAPEDVEASVLARADLDRIYVALSLLTERQREVLLAELGIGDTDAGSSASLKMLRMRARRRLRDILEYGQVVVFVQRAHLQSLWNRLYTRTVSAGSSADAAAMAGASAAALLSIMVPFQSVVPERGDIYRARVVPDEASNSGGDISSATLLSASPMQDLGSGTSLLSRGASGSGEEARPTLYQQTYMAANRAHEETWSVLTGHYRSAVSGAEEGSAAALRAGADAANEGLDRIERARSAGSLLQTKPKKAPRKK